MIEVFPAGPVETNAYVLTCPKTKECAVIDPAQGSTQEIMDFIEQQKLIPKMILLTHSHWDHIADTALLKQKLGVPVYIHALDAPNLEKPGADGLPCWIRFPGVHPDHFLEEGQNIFLGNLRLEVIHTPGHTPGGVCFYCKDEGLLISGDTLFQGSIGNLSFPTSQPELMWNSLDKLAKLPLETEVFPGHGPSTTIRHEAWLPNAKQVFGAGY